MVKRKAALHTPSRGDLVWLTFDPQSGREQAGRRPALILSPLAYNQKVGLALCCPITSRVKGYPFEVALPSGGPLQGVILADQVRSLDWRTRQAALIGKLPDPVLAEVIAKASTLLDP